MGKGSLYTVVNDFTTPGSTPAGGASYCTSLTDVVLSGSCSLTSDPELGLSLSYVGPINPTDTATQAGWQCNWQNNSSTTMYSVVTAVCLTIP
jgi:hypothetical protein